MKKILIVVVAVLLLGLALGGGYLLAGGGMPGAADAKTVEVVPGKQEPAPAAPVEGGKAAEAAKADAPPSPPAVPVRPVAAPAKGDARFAIELGVFRSAENAQQFAVALVERKLPVEIVETVDAAGQTWRRVRAGAFADRWQAEARLVEYDRIAGLNGVVVEEPALPAAPAKPAGGE
ncbi:SPOR domain-containing protein [Azospirillum rugosum]|uniref:Cell division septation protein DedD n=1 Tax=Azospirillum rugosum TaxID=416170 RepID=A0ABS4SD23_9PROT|nr:SPOR domain-containing protein [Azospirillum rugosum]MBP2290300.1 cell division septation protein DedD [Azospirillum rugosum]MDQ0527776.1 cell division septation protein DedD [Azospirillum rugosum]